LYGYKAAIDRELLGIDAYRQWPDAVYPKSFLTAFIEPTGHTMQFTRYANSIF